MRAKLTNKDISNLKYEMRTAYIFAIFFFVFGLASILGFYFSEDYYNTWSSVLITIIISGGVFFLIGHKYIYDISNKEKRIEEKQVQELRQKKDWEAGSASIKGGKKMNPYTSYLLIIDNYSYKVEFDLFKKCKKDSIVLFHIAPKSKHLLKIEFYK